MGTKLKEAAFLKSLAGDFDRHNKAFLEAWTVLIEYQSVPQEMAEEEWTRAIEALKSCHQATRFLYKIARLTKARVISSDLLYTFYYDDVTGYLREKLRFLVRWAGTGLDLAADYDSYELARIATSLIWLFQQLNSIHEKQGVDLRAEGHDILVEKLRDEIKDFIADPGRFCVGSGSYVGNYVKVTTW